MKINEDYESNDDRNLNRRVGLPTSLDPKVFIDLLWRGHVVDGRMGGMILGKSFNEGPARLVFKLGSSYVIGDPAPGGSFILGRAASIKNRARLKKMAAGFTLNEPVPDKNTDELGQLIVSTAYPHDRLIWVEFIQTVLNPNVGMHHCVELGRMNAEENQFLSCDLYQIFGSEPGPSDGII